jgi:hypothetical protein
MRAGGNMPDIDKHEQAWLDKVCALLEQNKKYQWVIGDALLEGEKWIVPGVSGKDLHEHADHLNHSQKGAEDEHTPYTLSIGGYSPYDEVCKRTGYDKSTLQDFMRVARAFPASKRITELSWSHHQACAAEWLTDKQRADLMFHAENQKLPLGTLRQRVRDLNTDEFGDAPSTKGYQQLSFKLPLTAYEKLEKISKREKRKVGNLMEQAVDLLFAHYDKQKKMKAA